MAEVLERDPLSASSVVVAAAPSVLAGESKLASTVLDPCLRTSWRA